MYKKNDGKSKGTNDTKISVPVGLFDKKSNYGKKYSNADVGYLAVDTTAGRKDSGGYAVSNKTKQKNNAGPAFLSGDGSSVFKFHQLLYVVSEFVLNFENKGIVVHNLSDAFAI